MLIKKFFSLTSYSLMLNMLPMPVHLISIPTLSKTQLLPRIIGKEKSDIFLGHGTILELGIKTIRLHPKYNC